MKKLDAIIRDANIKLFENLDFDSYAKNPSIFGRDRQEYIARTIRSIKESSRDSQFMLDVGCGTGNVLLIARNFYSRCVGVDVSFNFLREIKKRYGFSMLVVAEARYLPFKSCVFDLMSFYGVLHHIYEHDAVLKEASRVLKKGAILYTDHDPNYFLNRIYHIYYRIRFAYYPGFATKYAEIAEYYNTYRPGINPDGLKKMLRKLGFQQIQVKFFITSNPSLSPLLKIARFILRRLSAIFAWKSLFTHFSIIAQR